MSRYIETDPWDEHEYVKAQMDSDRLRKLHKDAKTVSTKDDYKSFSDIMADTFQSLRQPAPIINNAFSVPTLGEALLKELTETAEFKNLRGYTVGDTTASALASEIFGQGFLEEFQKSPELREACELENGGAPKHPLDYEKQLDKLRQAGRVWFDEGATEVQAMQAAAEALGDEFEQAMSNGQPMPMKYKLQAHRKIQNNHKLKTLMELAGRFRRIALEKRASVVKQIKQEMVGITTGNNMAKCIPSELALAADPLTAPIFFKKMMEGQLLQYDQHSHEKLGGGPIVICLDGSGSMAGEKEVWSKAVVMAYMAIAQKERRDLIVREFGGSNEIRDYSYPYRSKPELCGREQVMKLLENFLNGYSTDIQSPLEWAYDVITKTDEKFESADILIVTDGEDRLNPNFVEQFPIACKQRSIEVFGICIGAGVQTLQSIIPKSNLLHIWDITTADDAALKMLFER